MISNKDFISYIESFNGKFTDKDVLEIGFLHRNLESGKSWSTLADILGLESGEYLRSKILRELKKDNSILDPQEAFRKFESFTGNGNQDNSEFENLYKQKTQIRDVWNTYRRNLREDARKESLEDRIVEAINKLNESKPLKNTFSINLESDTRNFNNEAVLLLSDLHIGVEFDNFYNKYNLEIAKSRVNKLVKDTIKYCVNNKVKRLNVLGLGDNIHGIIHTNARIEQEFDLSQQIIHASEVLSQALFDLQQAAPEVTYRSVVDNHSRAIPSKDANIESENFNRVIDFILKERLKGTKVQFKEDNLDVGIGLFKLMNGKQFMFVHGHNDGINAALQNAVGATRGFVDYFAMGHYHSNKLKEYQGMTVFANGSVCGTEQYALSKRLFGDASQRLIIFENDDTIDIKINLQENRK